MSFNKTVPNHSGTCIRNFEVLIYKYNKKYDIHDAPINPIVKKYLLFAKNSLNHPKYQQNNNATTSHSKTQYNSQFVSINPLFSHISTKNSFHRITLKSGI